MVNSHVPSIRNASPQGLVQKVGGSVGKSGFRVDVNGLRGLAVLSVLLFHFQVQPFTGGFIGVDVFFVISGFLMTQIIFRGLCLGSFNVVAFYVRRFARIMPALLAVVLTALGVGYFLLLPQNYSRLATEALNSVIFMVNWRYAANTGYFGVEPAQEWLLHCWSLAVEFQFYLLYPLVMLVSWKLGKAKAVFWAMALMAALSLIDWAIVCQTKPLDAFFLLPGRVWEFVAGGAVALSPSPARRVAPVLATVGIATILLSAILFDRFIGFPSLWLIVPVAGAALTIWANVVPWALSNAVVQFLGTISYSLYLWHWPLLAIAHFTGTGYTVVSEVLVFAGCIVVAWVSYRAIEVPFRVAFRDLNGRSIGIIVGSLAALCACGVITSTNGLPSRVASKVLDQVSQAVHRKEYRDGTCFRRGSDTIRCACRQRRAPGMRGLDRQTAKLFFYASPETLVPQNHPFRPIRALVNAALDRLSPDFAAIYF